MRYLILRPATPVDPRRLTITSLQHLHEMFPVTVECSTETEAMESVRSTYPDALPMPVPVTVGSGEIFLLGIMEDAIKADVARLAMTDVEQSSFPFALFVQAVGDCGADRKQIANRKQFNRSVWRAPVVVPRDYDIHCIELRASYLENQVRTTVDVGRTPDGRLALRVLVNDVATSIVFDDADLALVDRDAERGL